MCSYCSLHTHSTHSFADGLAPVGDLVAKAALLGQPGIALTDHGNVFGAVELFKQCKEHGIKGLIGMEAYEAVTEEWDPERDKEIMDRKFDSGLPRYYHITLWAKNRIGWENLCRLHTLSYTKEFKPKNQPLIDRFHLNLYSEGLMIGLGCMASRTNTMIRDGERQSEIRKAAGWYKEVFGDDAYMEIMGNTDDQQALIHPQRKLAKDLQLQVITTNDVHYLDKSDGKENGYHHKLIQARAWKKKDGAEKSADKSDAGFGQWYGDGFHLKTGKEMLKTGGFKREEVETTLEVLDKANFDLLDLPAPKPPLAPIPGPMEDLDFEAFLRSGEDAWMDKVYAA